MNLSAVCLVLVSVVAVNVEAQVKKHVVLRNAEMEQRTVNRLAKSCTKCRDSSATSPTSSAGSEAAAEAELGPRQQPRQCAVEVGEGAAAATAAPTTPSAASSSWCPGAWGALERDM